MSTVRKGTIAKAGERCKHLRPFLKRKTAKRERQAAARFIRRG